MINREKTEFALRLADGDFSMWHSGSVIMRLVLYPVNNGHDKLRVCGYQDSHKYWDLTVARLFS